MSLQFFKNKCIDRFQLLTTILNDCGSSICLGLETACLFLQQQGHHMLTSHQECKKSIIYSISASYIVCRLYEKLQRLGYGNLHEQSDDSNKTIAYGMFT